MNGGNRMFENLRKLKVNLMQPKDGILLVVKGDFNDGDDISQYWMFSHDDLELVIWLMKHYDCWTSLSKKEKLLRQYIPTVTDSCLKLSAHSIIEFHAYAFENGRCMKIDVSACEMPNTSALYDRYYKGWDDDCEDWDDDYEDWDDDCEDEEDEE